LLSRYSCRDWTKLKANYRCDFPKGEKTFDGMRLPKFRGYRGSSDDRKTRWFLWGTVLTWALFIPTIIGIFPFLPGIAEQKATGMGATASGLAEGHVTFGLMLALLVPVGNNCLAESC